MDRRTFLSMLTAATATAGDFAWADAHRIDKVGLQMYTVRDVAEKDFEGTVAKVAAIGYRELELGSTVTTPPKAMRVILNRYGLVAPSTHIDYETVFGKWPEVLEACQIQGIRYVVIPGLPDEFTKDDDGWKRAAESLSRQGKITRKAGIQLAYHNHWHEFVATPSGKLPYDILLEESDPELLKMEMDLCWIIVGGGDPVKYFARFPGRFPMVHVKDLKKLPNQTFVHSGKFDGDDVIPYMTSPGSGVIDWKKIFSHSEEAGIRHYFVEHDHPANPIESVQASYTYLSKLRF